jgi:hypothetical protein
MIIHETDKSEVLSNHRITHRAEKAEDLLTWFDYYALHINTPCAIIAINKEVDGNDVKYNLEQPYAIAVLGCQEMYKPDTRNDERDIELLKEQGYFICKGEVYEIVYSYKQEQLQKDDLVVSIGGKIMQHGDFMTEIERV